MSESFLFLGTGASMGIPVPGCSCNVCLSSNSANKRLRSSGILEIGGKRFLIDPGPDFRQQALRYGISHLDGVLITHTHYDHVSGLDELKLYSLRFNKSLPCLLSAASYADLVLQKGYLFKDKRGRDRSWLELTIMEDNCSEVDFEGHRLGITSYFQNDMQVTGYRFDNFAYVIDMQHLTANLHSSFWKGIEQIVMSAGRPYTSNSHPNLEDILRFVKPFKQVWFSHISHELDHEEVSLKLPHHIFLAQDGLKIDVK